MFKSIKTTSPYEGNLKAERIRNSGAKLLCVPRLDLSLRAPQMEETYTSLPQHNCFRNYEQNCVPQMSLSYLKNVTLQGNINSQFIPFQSTLLHNHVPSQYF